MQAIKEQLNVQNCFFHEIAHMTTTIAHYKQDSYLEINHICMYIEILKSSFDQVGTENRNLASA